MFYHKFLLKIYIKTNKLDIAQAGYYYLEDQSWKDFINSINGLKNKLTMIIITHRVASLDICDKIYSIENGSLKLLPSKKKM